MTHRIAMKTKSVHTKGECEAAMNLDRCLKETRLLDYSHPKLVKLAEKRQWAALGEYDRIAYLWFCS